MKNFPIHVLRFHYIFCEVEHYNKWFSVEEFSNWEIYFLTNGLADKSLVK